APAPSTLAGKMFALRAAARDGRPDGTGLSARGSSAWSPPAHAALAKPCGSTCVADPAHVEAVAIRELTSRGPLARSSVGDDLNPLTIIQPASDISQARRPGVLRRPRPQKPARRGRPGSRPRTRRPPVLRSVPERRWRAGRVATYTSETRAPRPQMYR